MKTLDPGPGYDRHAKQYRQHHSYLDSFDWEPTRSLLVSFLDSRTQARLPGPINILDAGCGDGRVLFRLQRQARQRQWPVQLWGWDISKGMLQQAAKRLGPTVFLRRHDICRPPQAIQIPVGGFSLIIGLFVLVHLEKPLRFFTGARQSLADDGLLVVNTIPQKTGYTLRNDGLSYQIRYFHHSPDKIAQDLVAADFVIRDQVQTDFSTIIGAKIAKNAGNPLGRLGFGNALP